MTAREIDMPSRPPVGSKGIGFTDGPPKDPGFVAGGGGLLLLPFVGFGIAGLIVLIALAL